MRKEQSSAVGRQLVPDAAAGIDEVGRGPLAGPVVAAVVVLAPGQSIPGVRDSKALSPARRAILARDIRQVAVDWALGEASPGEIDALNILNATLLAMSRAFAGLRCQPGMVQVDGNRAPALPGFAGRIETIIGGDRTCLPISAASIIAKVHRDELMVSLHATYPAYGFDRHMGYPTREHRDVLAVLGPCPAHRRSFAPVRLAMGAVPVPGHARGPS
jgi:ribonuclease HII